MGMKVTDRNPLATMWLRISGMIKAHLVSVNLSAGNPGKRAMAISRGKADDAACKDRCHHDDRGKNLPV